MGTIKIIKLHANSQSIQIVSRHDKIMAKLIAHIGDYTLSLRQAYFTSLIKSIIGQQLSAKAAAAISGRFFSVYPGIDPMILDKLEFGKLRSIGISTRKIFFLKDLSRCVLDGKININSIHTLPDAEVISMLTQVKGIGRWTSEMFLIFSLGRQDVLALDDIGLQRAIKWLYQLQDNPTKEEMMRLGERWRPFRTIAALYLWEIINRDIIKFKPADVFSSPTKECSATLANFPLG